MLQTQATTRSPAPQTAAPAPASGPRASNQAAQETAGLAQGPPAEGGIDLMATLPTMGSMAAVVLAGMPVEKALTFALAMKTLPFVRNWLEDLDPDDVMTLLESHTAGLVELLFPSGSSIELRFSQDVAIGIGEALEGSFRLQRVGTTVKLQFVGQLAGGLKGGVGGHVGYEGLDRSGASASVKAELAAGAEAEWTLDPEQVLRADLGIVQDLLAGRAPGLEKLVVLCADNRPTTWLGSVQLGGAAEAGAAVANADVEVLPDGLSSNPAMATGHGMEAGTNLAFALFSGALGQVKASAKASCGYDEGGAVLRLALDRQAAAALFGFDGHIESSFVVEARCGGGAPGGNFRDTIRGTIKQRLATDDDAGSTEMTWKGVDHLDAILATIGLKPLAPGAPGFAPGELVLGREHRIDDPEAIEDLLGGIPAYDGLLRFVTAHAEARYHASVTVRMSEDTTPGFPGPAPQDVEAARDRQRALAGVILGEGYLTDLPVYALGAHECATLDKASVALVVDAGAGLGAAAAMGLKASASGSLGATYRREHDLTTTVDVADVERLLNA